MSLLYKGAIALGVACTGSIGTYYGIKSFNASPSIKNHLGNRLLDTFGSKNQTQWTDRLSSLRKDTIKKESLTPELQEIKDTSKNKTWEDLRALCAKRVKDVYEKEDSHCKEIIDYCTFKNKDKFTGAVIVENSVSTKWKKANGVIKRKTSGLSEALRKVKEKLEAASDSDNSALKIWCEGVYETPWTNNEGSDFQDAQQYCLDK